MVFNLVFGSNTILCFSFLFFNYWLIYFLIPAVITQSFIVAAELAIPTGIPTKEAKVKMERHPVTAEAKISKWSV